MIEFNRAIAYGCSWTVGLEIFDHEYIPDSDAIKRNRTKFMGNNYAEHAYNLLGADVMKQIDTRQRQWSWAGQVAKKCELPFENRAKNGNSLPGIMLDILEDINANKITDKDMILIGLTSENRLIDVSSNYKSILLAYPEDWPKKYKPYEEFFGTEVWTIEHVKYVYYTTMVNLIYICDKLLTDRVFIFKCSNRNSLDFGDAKRIRPTVNDYRGIFKQFEKIVRDVPYIFDKMDLYDYVQSANDIHGGGHPTLGVHSKFADYAYNCIKEYL